MPSEKSNIHANGLVFDGVGVVIRGASGSGKSLLTLRLLEFGATLRKKAKLVGDDRLEIFAQNQQLFMEAPDEIAGKIEMAGRGILTRTYQKIAPVNIVIDLVEQFQRMPDREQFSANLLGVQLDRCPVPALSVTGLEHQRLLVMEAIKASKNKMSH